MNYFVIILFLIIGVWAYFSYFKCISWILVSYTFLASFVIGAISPYQILVFWFALIFFIKYKKYFKTIKQFPFLFAFVCFSFSLVLTNFCVPSEFRHTPTLFYTILQTFGFSFVVWVMLYKRPCSSINRIIFAVYYFSLFISVYTIFETVTKTNPLLQFLVDSNCYIESKFITEIRFGFKRAQAIFSMHTTLGGVMLPLYTILLLSNKIGLLRKFKFPSLTIILSLVAIFMTGARSCIISAVICSLMYFSEIKFSRLLPVSLLVVVMIIAGGEYFEDIFSSIVSTDKVEGSNSDMRLMQFFISLEYFKLSPFLGNGIGFLYNNVILSGLENQLYGAESLWFNVMVDQGLIGVFAYLVLFISSSFYCWHRNNYGAILFVLAIFCMNSLSTIPGVNVAMLPAFTLLINYLYDLGKKLPK